MSEPAKVVRRRTHEVLVGALGIGGANPLRIQSMTTSNTQDIDATVRQAIALAEVGCEIVRITAPNPAAAKCLGSIRKKLNEAGFAKIPLVADIHFLPSAAMEAVEHVEKVRVNPGNYADKKKFAVKEYSDAEYERELQRLYDSFSPLVLRARALGRALRVGTNHGSLSDRIMNRYGDTPLGMVESALEFLRIAESHGFRQTVLSMKASSPKVMIQAYRLLVERMAQEGPAGMHYPLHLGVTEAGDGEDGRIKSAIGIGTLLAEGLGDTLRVSLTEDSVYEIPVSRALADKAESQWRAQALSSDEQPDGRRRTADAEGSAAKADLCASTAKATALVAAKAAALVAAEPSSIVGRSSELRAKSFEEAPQRRETAVLELAGGECGRTGGDQSERAGGTQGASTGGVKVGGNQVPAVVVRAASVAAVPAIRAAFSAYPAARSADRATAPAATPGTDTPLEGLLIPIAQASEITEISRAAAHGEIPSGFVILELAPEIPSAAVAEALRNAPLPRGNLLLREFTAAESETLSGFGQIAHEHGLALALALLPESVSPLAATLRSLSDTPPLIFTLADKTRALVADRAGALAAYRQLAQALDDELRIPYDRSDSSVGDRPPARTKPAARLWIRNTVHTAVAPKPDFLSRLLDAATLSGALLCDGIGDLVSIETEPAPVRALKLTYNVLQGAGARTSKTEFVACPSCGRTLFDLQTTTQRIRAKTGHLKGVKIAIMGCIVNGPGEMADADFGYVGGAPGKINLYVGKQCIRYNIPQAEADDRLIDLIKEHGKWIEPRPAAA